MDRLQQANQLLSWTEQQQLTAVQLQQASTQFALQPSADSWLLQANRILLFGSIVLLSCALIFFFAHNWPLMHYFSKFALAGGAVLLSGTIALFSPRASLQQRAALLATSILTGALLALIGQTYQTGADIWQLFAAWAMLITPLVLLSKSRACYLLWFVVLELTVWRYLDTHSLFWLFSAADVMLYLVLANLLLLLCAEFALPPLGVNANKPLVWLSALALLLPLTFGAMIGSWDASYHHNLLCYLLLGTVLALWYFHLRRDLLIFALLLFSAIAVATSLLARQLNYADSFLTLNLLALFVIGSSAAAAIWLKKLLQEPHNEH